MNKAKKIVKNDKTKDKEVKSENSDSDIENTDSNTENTDNNIEYTKSKKTDKKQAKEIIETQQTTLLHSPYIDTSLRCSIMLNPTQMDNKLKLYLKANLDNYTKGRCYLNYGYIVKINKIEDISDGRIEEEDTSCSAKFIVQFSCRLCFPAKNKEIICKIDRMNKAIISGINGPIKAIITPDKINKDNFYTDTDRNICIKKTSQILQSEMYIKVLILQSTFTHYDTNIIAISSLQNMATDSEIKFYEEEQKRNRV